MLWNVSITFDKILYELRNRTLQHRLEYDSGLASLPQPCQKRGQSLSCGMLLYTILSVVHGRQCQLPVAHSLAGP